MKIKKETKEKLREKVEEVLREEAKEENKFCRSCGGLLKQAKWNTKGDVLVCDNANCTRFRQPQGFVRVDRWAITDIFESRIKYSR